MTSAPSVSRPRMTTCSTSTRSTPCRVSAAKRTELTPGRSGPVTVMRTVVSGTRLAGLGVAVRALLALLRPGRRLELVGLAPHVRLVPELLHQVRVVQLERGPLGPDARELGEVV